MIEIDNIAKQANAELQFPLIFKINKGCRGDGVFYVTTMGALKQLIKSYFENNDYKIHDGFLLQQLIQTSAEQHISNYYRLNIVNGQIQSAMQFQLRWEQTTIRDIIKLVDFKGANDKPVSLATSNRNNYKTSLPHAPQTMVLLALMYYGISQQEEFTYWNIMMGLIFLCQLKLAKR